MSISQNPLTGGMKNSMANFITTTCGDKNVIRSKAFNPRNPNTSSQKTQRASFKLILEEHQSFGGITDIGFPGRSVNMSAFNMFMQANLPGAIDNSGGVPVVDYSKLKLAGGSLPAVRSVTASVSAAGITMNYRTNLVIPMVNASDEVVAIAKTTEGELLIARQVRGNEILGTILIPYPGIAATDILGCYLFVLTVDGKKASKSVYALVS